MEPIQKILKLMLAQRLIVMKNVGKGKRYYITERGRDVLRHFNKARESGLPIDRLNRVIM